jgi:hypothetical protein
MRKGFIFRPLGGDLRHSSHKLKPQWKNSIENDPEIKGCFRWGSKIQGSMKLSNPRVISWTPWWVPRPKKWQMQAKPTWHHYGGKINWLRPPKNELKRGRAWDLKNQDAS